MKSTNIHDYVQSKNEFCAKNKSKKFQEAIQQADEAITKEKQQDVSSDVGAVENFCKITLKTMAIDDLLKTFGDNEASLRSIFDEKRGRLDRFN